MVSVMHVQHTSFCTSLWRCFARLQRETSRFYVRNIVWVLAHFFLSHGKLPLNFTLHWWPLAFLIFSPVRRYKIFMLFFQQQKKCLLCFLSLALDFCRPFSRWASLACRLLSLFLCLSLALYSKFVDMTIYLSLILLTTRIQKKFPLSVFVFIDSFVVSALQDAGGYPISRQNNLELHLDCHTCWLS